MLRIGYHVSIANSLDLAFDRASQSGCTAMQIFVSNPRGWAVNKANPSTAAEFRKKEHRLGITPVAHMPYLPNLASSSHDIHSKSIKSLQENLEQCSILEIKYLVAHLGSHMGHGTSKGITNAVNAIDGMADKIGDVILLLENQAGHSHSIGATLDDLITIYDKSVLSGKKRLGFCLDTCHLFASGYDIRKESEIEKIDEVIGIEKVHVIHVNDAKYELGSGKDRHENIGFGHIGREGFATFLNYNNISKKALILETPAENLTKEDEIAIIMGIVKSA